MPTTTEDIGGARDENSLCPKTIPRAKGKGDCHCNDVVNEKCGYCRGNGMLEISRALLILPPSDNYSYFLPLRVSDNYSYLVMY